MTKTLWKVVGLLIIASISSAFVMQIATPPNVSVEIEEATLFLYGEDHALLRVIGTIENNGLQTVAISATRRRLVTGFILAGEDKKMHALPQQFSPGQAFKGDEGLIEFNDNVSREDFLGWGFPATLRPNESFFFDVEFDLDANVTPLILENPRLVTVVAWPDDVDSEGVSSSNHWIETPIDPINVK